MYTSKLLLMVFIFLTIMFSSVNIGKLIYRDKIPSGNMILNAVGIAGIIAYFI